MKKKLLLVISMVALLACLFAITVSAETVLKSQTTNAYGEISLFDESITVGRTNTTNGFNPYMADGTTYARVVVGDGKTFYTFPTAYVLSNTAIYGGSGKSIYVFDIASLNSAMQTATGTNPGWTKTNIYRMEMPANIAYLNGGEQKFYAYSNMIELYLNPNMTTWDTGSSINCLFHSCTNLTTIHNIDTFLFRSTNNTSGAFQNCTSLTSLTLGVSPDIKKIGSSMFSGCTNLERVNIVEAFPNATEMATSVFAGCTDLVSISSNQKTDGIIELSYTYYENSVFQNCDSIRAVKFTASSAKLFQNVFNSLDSLEYIYFPRNSKLELPSCEVFSNNQSLKAIALPDNCTTLPDRGFKNCANLKAVYLPANLTTMVTNGWDQSPFTSDPELYFVNDWFNVLDANGDFLLDKFVMPQRPHVYYFPSTLTNLCDQKTSATGFYNCYKINPVLVFGEGVTQFIPGDGLLINCGTQGEVKTVVFLGNMTKVCHSSQDSRLQNIQYVFANANDKSTSDVEIVNNHTNNPGSTAKIFFCASGTSYQMIPKNGTYGDSLGATHFYHIAKETAPTCTQDGVRGYVCFCTKPSPESETIKALGHKRGDTVISTAFPMANGAYNYFANMISVCPCATCGVNADFEEANTALFATDKGYSFSETDASSISYTLHVNKDAIEAYMKDNIGFMYGIVVSASPSASPIKVENGAVSGVGNTLVIEMQNTEYTYSYVRAKLTFGEDFLGKEFNCQAYVVDNSALTYVGHEGVSLEAEVVSHAILVEKYESKEDF